MKWTWRVIALIVLMCTTNFVQAIVPSQQVTWTQPVSPSIAQSYLYKLYITEESGIKKVISLGSVLCGPSGIGSACSIALPVEANIAIITGNISYLTATNPVNNIEGPASAPFTGNQGCIFRDNLFKVGTQTKAQTNKQGMQALLKEFQAAKFKHISTQDLKGNQYVVTEECAGYIVR